MATNDIPIVEIKHQSQTNAPVNGDVTLVDDATVLVDDSVALVGGPTTPIENLVQAIDNLPPRAIIKKYR